MDGNYLNNLILVLIYKLKLLCHIVIRINYTTLTVIHTYKLSITTLLFVFGQSNNDKMTEINYNSAKNYFYMSHIKLTCRQVQFHWIMNKVYI